MNGNITLTAGTQLTNYLAGSPAIPDMKTRLRDDMNSWPTEISPTEAVDHMVDRHLYMIRNSFPLMHSETWVQMLNVFSGRTEVGTRELYYSTPASQLMEMHGMSPEAIRRIKQRGVAETNGIVHAFDELTGLTVAETVAMIYAIERWWGCANNDGDLRKFLGRLFCRPQSLLFTEDLEDYESYEEARWDLWEFEEVQAESDDVASTTTVYTCVHKDYVGLELTLLCVREADQEQISVVKATGEAALKNAHYMIFEDLVDEIYQAWFRKVPMQAS